MSQAGKIAAPGKVKRRRIWFAVISVILVGIGVLAAILWYNRYSILEDQFRKRLEHIGVNAELEIVKIGSETALIRNVRVSASGEEIFDITEVELHYVFKQALKGQFEKIILRDPTANIALGADGQWIGDWLPQTSGQTSASTLPFPVQGVVIDDGVLNWHAPFGHGKANINADITTLSQWNLSLDAPNTVLTSDDVVLKLDIHSDVQQTDAQNAIATGAIRTRNMDTPQLRADSASIDFNFSFARRGETDAGVKGWLYLEGLGLDMDGYAAQSIKLKLDIDTLYNMESHGFAPSTTHWNLDSRNVKVKDKAERLARARTLTAYEAMILAPIAQYFADIYPQKLEHLLSQFSATGAGDFVTTGNGYEVRLKDTFLVKATDQSLHITTVEPNTLVYRDDLDTLKANVDMNWTGEYPIQVQGLKLQARTSNGFQLEAMQTLSARIVSASTWRKRRGKQAFRLAPFTVDLDYTQVSDTRHVRLNGTLDYDGLIPGGAVTGLMAAGEIRLNMRGNTLTLGFDPATNIHMDTFESGTGWRVENIEFAMEKSDNLMRTKAGGRVLLANLNQVHANIISPTGDRHLDMKIESLQATTLFKGFPQIWDIMMDDVYIKSEDFPSPGTRIVSKSSALQVELTKSGDITFVSENPVTSIETENVSVEQIKIDLTGSPDDFVATYNTKAVEFLGGEVPILPMRGTARLKSGTLTGQAATDLPFTENTPIDMEFRSVNGRGTLKMNIPAINFTPNGLQPQYLIPSLRGKLAEVTGTVSATFDFAFGGGEPIQSHGTTTLIDMNIGTLVGPLQGVNTELVFSSIFPLKTDGVQRATLAGFDPGFPLENGTILFEIIPGGIRIDEAIWPVLNTVQNTAGIADLPAGKIYIAPMEWRFGNVVNQAVVHIEDIELGTLLAKVGKDKLTATGRVSGVLPARIEGVNLNIENGLLEVKDGGIIQLKAAGLGAAGARNEYAGHAVKALENFTYKKMEARIDGPLDGSIQLAMEFEGNNEDVLGGQPFLFNVGVEGELANIARNLSKSFNSQENLKRILDVNGVFGDEQAPE